MGPKCNYKDCNNYALNKMRVCINHLSLDAAHILFNEYINKIDKMENSIRELKDIIKTFSERDNYAK
jgi:hypothetical protein